MGSFLAPTVHRDHRVSTELSIDLECPKLLFVAWGLIPTNLWQGAFRSQGHPTSTQQKPVLLGWRGETSRNVASIAKTPQCLTRMYWNHNAPCLGLIEFLFIPLLPSQVWRGFSSEASRDGPGKLSGRPHSVIRSRLVSIFVETKYWPNMLHASEAWKRLPLLWFDYCTFTLWKCFGSAFLLRIQWFRRFYYTFKWFSPPFTDGRLSSWLVVLFRWVEWDLPKSRRGSALCEKTSATRGKFIYVVLPRFNMLHQASTISLCEVLGPCKKSPNEIAMYITKGHRFADTLCSFRRVG